jgi:hypothetical protein
LLACLHHNRIFLPALAFLLASRLDGSVINRMRRMKRGVRTLATATAGTLSRIGEYRKQ